MLTVLAAAQFASTSFAQQQTGVITTAQTGRSEAVTFESPYRTRGGVDGAIIGAGVGLSGLGLYLIQKNKSGPNRAELDVIDADIEGAKMDVPKFDRFAAGYYSSNARTASDFLFYPSFALPFLLLKDEKINRKAGQVAVLYVETMAITGTLFTLTAAHVERKRPLVYNNDPDNKQRSKKHAQNSFYAGHTAAAASATFFAAKVFHDFNPDSRARPYIWGAAAAIPATVGYLRLKAGKHFLSDNILGYALGASAGILVPQLHKTKGLENVSITPLMGLSNGMAATVTF